ncbi:MAG: GNAT family N-acetyltransferase [Caulobacterales bacterium]
MRSRTPIIDTQRLALRAFENDDAANIARLAGDFDVAKMTSSMPHPYPKLAAEGFIMLTEAGRARGKDMPFAITLPGEGLIGAAGFHAGANDNWEFGYWIGKPFWGKGFATEAAKALLGWWDDAMSARTVAARRFFDNPASGRVLEKVGFKPTGETLQLFSLARLAKIPSVDYIRGPEPDGFGIAAE